MVLRRGRVSGWVEVGFETSSRVSVMRGGEGGGDTVVFVDHFECWTVFFFWSVAG